MEQHPLSAAFPSMSDEDFSALRDSIENIGVQNPITVYQGMVIDGWHRYRAANELGMECPSRELDPATDPRDFVLAQNKARRNCTASQLAAAAVKVYGWKGRGNPQLSNSAPGADLEETDIAASEIAERAGVSTRTIEQAKKVERKASPEVKKAVERGEVSVKAAAKVADLPPEQQVQALHAPKPTKLHTAEVDVLKAQVAELKQQLADAIEQRDHVAEELDSALRILRADDRVAQALAEVERFRAQASAARSRVDGLMNERNAAIRRVKALEKAHVKSAA